MTEAEHRRVMTPRARVGAVLLAAGALVVLLGADLLPALIAQGVPKPGGKVMWVMPNWLGWRTTDARWAEETAQLRGRLGEGRYTRVGFAVYVGLSMDDWNVDPNDREAIRRNSQRTIAEIDLAIARAQAAGVRVCLSVLSAIRERYDPLQQAAEGADVRHVQWFPDHVLSRGWVTHSRYARRLRLLQEAYFRELGRVLANRMAKHPGVVVCASGDGEVELSYERSNPPDLAIADYSPFAVAEFRDWLRAGGLYADGQPLAGQAWQHAARYKGDATPGEDTNRDGRTLNGDFGLAFSTWDLRYFHWDLADNPEADARRVPLSDWEAPGFNRRPDAGASRFDAPRALQPRQPWFDVWDEFRQHMVWRHNLDVARWVTTSPDPETGLTVPAERWFTDQIPADYLFGSGPTDRAVRYLTSASPWWTADVTPYGGIGVTSFNIYDPPNNALYPTLRSVAPLVAGRQARWGVLEYHPSLPNSAPYSVYQEDMGVIERHRPAVIVPIFWDDPYYSVKNTNFEVMLRELVRRTKDGPPGAASDAGAPLLVPPSLVVPSGRPADSAAVEWMRGRKWLPGGAW